ncbi:hypothetical protein DFH06DRAFT_1345098 [Mycena polygramma]|nr:hypothetical protein DFH06DRAFT_1345098 [Mycena polygramma]
MPAASSSDTTTHASRNPSKAVQKTRRRVGRPLGKLTEGQKATRALQAAQRKAKRRALADDIDDFYEYRETTIDTLAAKHKRSREYIKSLLTGGSRLKTTRAVSLRNALVHDLWLKAQARGETISLKELAAAADEAADAPRTAAEIKELKQQLKNKRKLQRVGLRGNNIAAGADSRATVGKIQDEIMNLHERTGTRCVALFTRGHVDDTFMPTYAEAGGSFDFFIQAMKTPGLDVIRLFEQWSCTQDRNGAHRDSISAMKKEIKTGLDDSLHRMIKNEDVQISYARFLTDIKQAWKVKLVGWPDDIPFVKPSELGTNDRIRRICSGLRSGDIHWVYLQPEEIEEVEAEVERRRAQGTLHKKRKPRADKGGKHKSQRRPSDSDDDDDDKDDGEPDDDDDEPPARPAAPARRPLPAPAAASRSTSTRISGVPATATPTVAATRGVALASPAVVASPFVGLPAASGVPYLPTTIEGSWGDSRLLSGALHLPSTIDGGSSNSQLPPASGALHLPSTVYGGSNSVYNNQNYLFFDFDNIDYDNLPPFDLTHVPTVTLEDIAAGFGGHGGVVAPTFQNTAASSVTTDPLGNGFMSASASVDPSPAPSATVTGGTAAPVQFRAPATPATFGGDANDVANGASAPKAKKPKAPAVAKPPAAKKQHAGDPPRARKVRSDKGKPRAKQLALENETPEERDARLAAKKAAALRKIAARM